MRFAILIVLVALCASCTSSPNGKAVSDVEDRKGVMVLIPQGSIPILGTNDVLRIAQESARNRRFRMDDYECDAIMYQLNATNRAVAATWLVHFVTKPAVPDMDFFVRVEDRSGKSELWVP